MNYVMNIHACDCLSGSIYYIGHKWCMTSMQMLWESKNNELSGKCVWYVCVTDVEQEVKQKIVLKTGRAGCFIVGWLRREGENGWDDKWMMEKLLNENDLWMNTELEGWDSAVWSMNENGAENMEFWTCNMHYFDIYLMYLLTNATWKTTIASTWCRCRGVWNAGDVFTLYIRGKMIPHISFALSYTSVWFILFQFKGMSEPMMFGINDIKPGITVSWRTLFNTVQKFGVFFE